jgi:hypothetical protein
VSARRQRGGTRTVQLRAVGYSSLVADYPLTFPPPLAEYSANPSSFESSWHLIQYVFNLPDPRAFPPFVDEPSGKPVQILRRYSAASLELAESEFLAHPTSLTVHVLDGGKGERIDPSFAPRENIRGFSVLFRQFYSDKEPASFHAARRTLGQLNVHAGDDLVSVRDNYLRTWRQAAAKLRGYPLKILVGKQLQAQGRWHPGELVGERDPGPEMLISTYNYGEDIHWGEKREQVAAWDMSPFDSAWMRVACFDAMVPLAHVYLGFAQIVDAALIRQL